MVAVIKSTSFLVICAVIIVTNMIALRSPSAAAGGSHHDLVSFFPTTADVCHGSMAECLAASAGEVDDFDFDIDEFQMDSETNRRMLQARRRYISYGALSRNTVPCSRRGASYYNCRSGAQANPYSRGCSTITRCRR